MKFSKFEKSVKFFGRNLKKHTQKSSHKFQNQLIYMFIGKYDNFIMRKVKLKYNVTHYTNSVLSKILKIIVKTIRNKIWNKL